MAQDDDDVAKGKAFWNDNEVDAYLDYLITQRSRIAGTNFKEVTYNEAAGKIANHRTHGPVKTKAHCRTKWGSVCYRSHHSAIMTSLI